MNYALNSKVTFSHLFVLNWDSNLEVLNYPPVSGPFAVYQKSEFYDSINFAINQVGFLNDSVIPLHFLRSHTRFRLQYGNLSDSIGPYSHLQNGTHALPLEFHICRHVGTEELPNQLREQCGRKYLFRKNLIMMNY